MSLGKVKSCKTRRRSCGAVFSLQLEQCRYCLCCDFTTPIKRIKRIKGTSLPSLPPQKKVLQLNDVAISGKPLNRLYKMRYILWVVALLEAYDVTKHGRHLGFYQELEISYM